MSSRYGKFKYTFSTMSGLLAQTSYRVANIPFVICVTHLIVNGCIKKTRDISKEMIARGYCVSG